MFYLVMQYYVDKNEERQEEIDAVLTYNIKNENIDKVIILAQNNYCNIMNVYSKFKTDKTEIHEFERLKFSNVFEFCKKNIPNNAIVAIVNNDIILDPNIKWIESIPHKNIVQCLTRHEIYHQGKCKIDEVIYQSGWAQDTWVFQNPMRDLNFLDFKVGNDPGCDNAIVQRFAEAGLWCINEAHKYKTYHIDCAPSRKCIGQVMMVEPSNKKECGDDWCNPVKEGGYNLPICGAWKESKLPFKLLDILPNLKYKYHSSYFEVFDNIKL
mgnify:CR=1 FL=1